jgi:hypothetical protein
MKTMLFSLLLLGAVLATYSTTTVITTVAGLSQASAQGNNCIGGVRNCCWYNGKRRFCKGSHGHQTN